MDPTVSLGRPLSDEVRASLEAVRVAQASAQMRARRQTVQARVWFAGLLGVIVLVGLALAPRVARWRQARALARTSAPASAVAPKPATPATASPMFGTAIGEAPGAPARPPAQPALSATEPTPVAAPRQAREAALAPAVGEGCDTTLLRRAPWRLSPEACAKAFESDPTNAALALAIAHAEHGHAHFEAAAGWAKRALTLKPNAAEAYLLIARADVKGGRPDDARAAYERYLELAPRGWHGAEARAALGRTRTTPPPASARAR